MTKGTAARTTILLALLAFLSVAGCKSNSNQPSVQNASNTAQPVDQNDPAFANLAPVSNGDQTVDPNVSEAGPQQVPASSSAPETRRHRLRSDRSGDQSDGYASGNYNDQNPNDQNYNEGYDEDYQSQPVEYAEEPPPPLPQYDQPPCPGDGYIWTPGYWAYASNGYYWTPGAWTLAPYTGALWTPGYWSFNRGRYGYHNGYWGRYIGYYGDVNYGDGYSGRGYQGGYWDNDRFRYNRTVNNINTTNITNVYNRTVVNNVSTSRVSYVGGNGIQARPTVAEIAAARAPARAPDDFANPGTTAGGNRPRTIRARESGTARNDGSGSSAGGGSKHQASSTTGGTGRRADNRATFRRRQGKPCAQGSSSK